MNGICPERCRQAGWRKVGAAVWLLLVLCGPAAQASDTPAGLPLYYTNQSGVLAESDVLVGTPGTSATLGAGLFNPAAFSMLQSGGVHVSWRDMVALENDPKDWLAVLSARNVAFAMQRFQLRNAQGDWDHLDEYTAALSWGDRESSTGLAYSWSRGGCGLLERHKRLTAGSIRRWRLASVGTAGVFDMERKNHYAQADLGLRPLGPRLTLFADAVYRYRDEFEEINFGYGLEAWPLPGLCLAGKLRDDGDFSLRVELSFGEDQVGGRLHYDKDGDHLATTYAVEVSRPLPSVGEGLFGRRGQFPELSLKGPTVYRTYDWFDDRRRLLATLGTIEHWSRQPEVGGLVLNLSGVQLNPALMWELREQLAGFRAAGKTVTVYFDRLSLGTYALASVADEIWMDPVGNIDVRGMTLGRTYMNRMLEKIGLGVDEFRLFTYKSAFEGFSRTSMSDADREQLGAILEDWFATLAETICTARGLSQDELDRLMNEKGELYGKEALTAGLVDSLGTFERVKERARKVAPRATGDVATTDIAAVRGATTWQCLEWGAPPEIAVIYGIGECAMESGIKGPELAKTIKRAADDPKVKAIVFRADSPGGDPLPSDLVAREMKRAAEKKPVIVSQGMVAGAGGYWISMYGDSILASPFTITGSIGVISGHIYNTTLGERAGLDYDYVTKGDHSDLMTGFAIPLLGQQIPHRPYTEQERGRAEEVIRALYDDFVEKVAEGRGMTPEAVDAVGQGRIWSGVRGRDLGLVDEVGGLWESIALAKASAGLGERDRIRLTEGPSLGKFRFPSFGSGLGITSRLGLGGDRPEAPAAVDGPYDLNLERSFLLQLLGADVVETLSAEDRLYLEQLLRAPGRPLLMMEPYQFETGSRRGE
jgi:protease IV